MSARSMNSAQVPLSIQPLQKITLAVASNESRHQETVSFIFGIGASGLCPFEYALAGKAVGDRIELAVEAANLCETFQHLTMAFFPRHLPSEAVSLQFHILETTAADSREIIQAMAKSNACGHDGCDCGCGCP